MSNEEKDNLPLVSEKHSEHWFNDKPLVKTPLKYLFKYDTRFHCAIGFSLTTIGGLLFTGGVIAALPVIAISLNILAPIIAIGFLGALVALSSSILLAKSAANYRQECYIENTLYISPLLHTNGTPHVSGEVPHIKQDSLAKHIVLGAAITTVGLFLAGISVAAIALSAIALSITALTIALGVGALMAAAAGLITAGAGISLGATGFFNHRRQQLQNKRLEEPTADDENDDEKEEESEEDEDNPLRYSNY